MRKLIYILPFILTGCLEEIKLSQSQTECFEVHQTKELIDSLMVNKCTGETWLLVRTILSERTKSEPESFTYQWHPIPSITTRPVLSYGWDKGTGK